MQNWLQSPKARNKNSALLKIYVANCKHVLTINCGHTICFDPKAIEDIRQGKAHPLDLLFNFLGKLITDEITNRKKCFVRKFFIGNFLFVNNKKKYH